MGSATTPTVVGAFNARAISGDTTGTAVPAGYIGQIISGTLTSSVSLTASLADVTALTVTLTPGVWLLTVALQFQCFNGQAVAWLVSGASTPVAAMGEFAAGTTEFMAAQSIVVPINISATTTYKIQAYRTGAQAIIYGDTIAYPGMSTGQSKLVAVRIA